MYISKSRIYLQPAEDITDNSIKNYSKRIELETKVDGKSLFVNEDISVIFRDKEKEVKNIYNQNETRFSFDYDYQKLFKLLQIKKVLYWQKLENMRNLYLAYRIYAPEKHFTEVQINENDYLEDYLQNENYTLVNIEKRYTGYLCVFMNKAYVVVPMNNQFGTTLTKDDLKLIKELERK